jgi:hypothetical protein
MSISTFVSFQAISALLWLYKWIKVWISLHSYVSIGNLEWNSILAIYYDIYNIFIFKVVTEFDRPRIIDSKRGLYETITYIRINSSHLIILNYAFFPLLLVAPCPIDYCSGNGCFCSSWTYCCRKHSLAINNPLHSYDFLLLVRPSLRFSQWIRRSDRKLGWGPLSFVLLRSRSHQLTEHYGIDPYSPPIERHQSFP